MAWMTGSDEGDVADDATRKQRRDRLNFVLLLLGVGLIGLAVWGGPVATQSPSDEIVYPQVVWLLYAAAGILTVGGVAIGQRWHRVTVARVMVAAAGVVLLLGLLAFRDLGGRAWLTLALPGVALLAMSWLLAPVPAPRE